MSLLCTGEFEEPKEEKVEKFAALNLRLTFKVVNLVMNEILGPHAHGTSQQRCVKPYACDDVEKLSRSSLGSVWNMY